MEKNNNKNHIVAEPVAMTYGMSDELYARIAESHQAYLKGEVLTAEEARNELRTEFLWLR